MIHGANYLNVHTAYISTTFSRIWVLKHYKYIEIKQFFKVDIKRNNIPIVILLIQLPVYQWETRYLQGCLIVYIICQAGVHCLRRLTFGDPVCCFFWPGKPRRRPPNSPVNFFLNMADDFRQVDAKGHVTGAYRRMPISDKCSWPNNEFLLLSNHIVYINQFWF